MRENMTHLDEKLEIVKANEARVEEENARLIEQLKVSKENEAKARNASEAKAENSDSPTAGFTWKAILGGCVNSSDMDDWTLLLHNRNVWSGEPSDAYWYGLEGMHRRTSVGR